jgi:hypothetical protein
VIATLKPTTTKTKAKLRADKNYSLSKYDKVIH